MCRTQILGCCFLVKPVKETKSAEAQDCDNINAETLKVDLNTITKILYSLFQSTWLEEKYLPSSLRNTERALDVTLCIQVISGECIDIVGMRTVYHDQKY